MTFRKPTKLLFSFCLLLAFASCGTGEGPDLGTETNWLKLCEKDADCGSYSCECGVCTSFCQRDADCEQADAVCSPADSQRTGDLCDRSGDPLPSQGLCLSDQQGSGGAGSGGSTAGSGGTGASASTGGAASGGSASGGSATGGAASGGSAAGGAAGDSAGGASLGGSSGGVEGLACPDSEPPLDGCCWTDADCGEPFQCYWAADPIDCAVEPVGRCIGGANGPPVAGGSCFEDRDCPAAEECVGASLGACGKQQPNAVGVCTPTDASSCGEVTCPSGAICCDRCTGSCVSEFSGAYCPEDARPDIFSCGG